MRLGNKEMCEIIGRLVILCDKNMKNSIFDNEYKIKAIINLKSKNRRRRVFDEYIDVKFANYTHNHGSYD